MHPFRTDETFVRNTWYVACAAEDIGSKPFERVILGQPVAFYRAADGTPMAMHGVCPHRNYPLALRGRVDGDALVCAYHGFTYDGRSGACVRVPSQKSVPKFQQRIYPVVERGPWIWIWPGDPALADVSSIPSLEEMGLSADWHYVKPFSFLNIKARYMFLVENLLDLTHLGYLHGDMGDFDLYVKSPLEIEESGERLRVVRPMRDGWTQQHDVMFGPQHRFEGLSDFASITTYYGPGYCTTTGHITTSIDSLPHVDKKIYGDVYFHHAVTPATAHSCHYFGTSSRTHRLDETAFDDLFYPFDAAVRQQDIDAAEAIEAHMLEFGEPSVELMVKSDAAAGRVRRKIQRAIDEESKSVSVGETA